MKGQSMHHKLMLLSATFMLCAQSMGCITIRDVTPSHAMPIANRVDHAINVASADECCELYDRRDALRRIAKKLNPAHLVPTHVVGWAGSCKDQSMAWMSNQYGRCASVKGSVQGWIQDKKDEANAPPWPRFHPIPTQDVFEPQEPVAPFTPEAPEVYGRFGRG